MNVKKWLKLVAKVGPSEISDDDGMVYYSKFDGSYITRVGMEKYVKFLADRNITEQLTHGIGFSSKDNKWYGWSHRAIFGFTIGSTCLKGDCHYMPSSDDAEIEKAINFWSDEHNTDVQAKKISDGLLKVTWTYLDNFPNKKLHNAKGGADWYYKLGRGEWTAKTMDDARQMAVDFNEGVS